MKNRVLSIEGVINFRDIGGYSAADQRQVAWGKVYRSAQLDKLSAQGVQQMVALKVKTVVDLRFNDETERYPTIRRAFPSADFISWQSELTELQTDSAEIMKRSWRDSLDSGDAGQVREAMRVNYPVKLYSHRGVYREMLRRLINDESPLVFHCAAGKDRTGVAAALILSLLGVSDEDIVEDYLISQSQVSQLLDTWVAGGAADSEYNDFQKRLAQYPRALVQPVFDADVDYITTLLDYIKETYTSFTDYAMEVLALEQGDIQQLRKALLV